MRFVVTETLAGRDTSLNATTIGKAVFVQGRLDNPMDDPIVRIESARVSRRLLRYYQLSGRNNPIRISIPDRDYVPCFAELKRGSKSDANSLSGAGNTSADVEVEEPPQTYRDLILPIGIPFGIVIMIGLALIQPIRTLALQMALFRDRPMVAKVQNLPSVIVEPFSISGAVSDGAQLASKLTASIAGDLSKLDGIHAGISSDATSQSARSTAQLILRGTIRAESDTNILDLTLVDEMTGSTAWRTQYEIRSLDADAIPYEIARHVGAVAKHYHDKGASPAPAESSKAQ